MARKRICDGERTNGQSNQSEAIRSAFEDRNSGRGGRLTRFLERGFLRSIDAEVVPFTLAHFEAAARAFLRFGKGRHPAALNYGDCMAYATARVAQAKLLYTGDDFSNTDITSA